MSYSARFDNLRPAHLYQNMIVQCGLAYQFLYCSAISAIKISILSFYQRLFSTPKFKQITSIVGAVVIAYWIVVIMATIFGCRPVQGYWDKTIKSYCINRGVLAIAVAGLNVLTDVVILLLPIPIIWHLQIALRQRFALSFVFLLGSL